MRISRIRIRNFRNFSDLDVNLNQHAVIVGENAIGKSNLVFALRLLLDPIDPTLPDAERRLRLEDFWDGLPKPLPPDAAIEISLDLTHFEDQDDLLALLAEHIVDKDPITSRLTYRFQPIEHLDGEPKTEADYDFLIYGGDRQENLLPSDLRQRIPLVVLPALRDAESDLERWRRSPLRPLLEAVSGEIGAEELDALAADVEKATAALSEQSEIRALVEDISSRLGEMVGAAQSLDLMIGFSPTKADRLIRALRLFIDGGARTVADASLGSANLLYLALKTLELKRLVDEGQRSYTLLAIEEPEAHLHPHLQRLIYRDFLRARTEPDPENEDDSSRFVILTTHSPHVASVTPLRSLVVLKNSPDGFSTVGVSTADLDLDDHAVDDLERYLDVTRGEILFAKGILLVEGMAEAFVVPRFAQLLGHDLDRLGISVCSVEGTNFAPYVTFLGPEGLQMPFAVLTDMDPRPKGDVLGLGRAALLLIPLVGRDAAKAAYDDGSIEELAAENGIFLNSNTLEVDIWGMNAVDAVCDALSELAMNTRMRERCDDYRQNGPKDFPDQLLKDIDRIGKGRFAQRLCADLTADHCPAYISRALDYVIGRAG